MTLQSSNDDFPLYGSSIADVKTIFFPQEIASEAEYGTSRTEIYLY